MAYMVEYVEEEDTMTYLNIIIINLSVININMETHTKVFGYWVNQHKVVQMLVYYIT